MVELPQFKIDGPATAPLTVILAHGVHVEQVVEEGRR